MTQLRRNSKVVFKPVKNNFYKVLDADNNVLLNADDDYFVYMKNVNFRDDGTINGRYLGVATDSLIDEYCVNATYEFNGFYVNGEKIKTARMVAVKNKSKVIVVIQSK